MSKLMMNHKQLKVYNMYRVARKQKAARRKARALRETKPLTLWEYIQKQKRYDRNLGKIFQWNKK